MIYGGGATVFVVVLIIIIVVTTGGGDGANFKGRMVLSEVPLVDGYVDKKLILI